MPRTSRVRRRRYLRKRLLAQRRQARVRDVIAKLRAHMNPPWTYPEWLQREYAHAVQCLNADLFRDGKGSDHTVDVIRYAQFSFNNPSSCAVIDDIESNDDEW